MEGLVGDLMAENEAANRIRNCRSTKSCRMAGEGLLPSDPMHPVAAMDFTAKEHA